MSTVGDRLAQRTADLSYIPTSNAQIALSLPTTYYSGPTLHAAGTTTASYSDKLASRKASQLSTQATVNATLSSRRAAKTAADNLAKAQAAAKAAQDQINGLKDSYSISTPTKANIGLSTIPSTSKNVKGGTRTINVPNGGSYGGGSGKGYTGTGGTSQSIKLTGYKGNNSGAAGAIGGSGHSGQTGYAYNNSLGAGRNKALALAVSYLGTRYVLGGSGRTGIDCSGLVQTVYRQLGFKVPTHSAADQGQTGGRHNGNGIPGTRTSIGNLKPGDLVAWKDGSHIAIYAGGGKIIEAANPTRGTIYRTLWAPQSAVIGIHLNLPGDGKSVKSVQTAQKKSVAAATSKKLQQYR